MRSTVSVRDSTITPVIGRWLRTLSTRHVLIGVWMGIFSLSMLVGISLRPLTEPDEGRNAEIAREMLTSGDYLLPQLNYLPHIDKPPAYSAVLAFSLNLLGFSEGAARLPSWIAMLLTAILTGVFARRLFGKEAQWLATGALLVMPLAWAYGQIVILDAFFTLLITGAMLALHEAVERQDRRHVASLLGWALIAIAILTKGPIGLLLPLLVMIPYAVWRGRISAVLAWHGMLLAAAVVTPWVWLVGSRLPDFWHYVAVVETWQRVTSDTLHRSKPFWYFIPILLVGAFPWSVPALASARRAWQMRRQAEPRWVLLALWIVLPWVFFSLSRSKLPHYVLPLLPAFALAVAGLWTGTRGRLPGLKAVSWTWVGVGGICLLALPALRTLPEPYLTESWGLLMVAGAALAAGFLGLRTRGSTHLAAWIVTLPLLVLYCVLQPFLFSLSEAFSSRDLARVVALAVNVRGQVIGVHAYPLSMPFYLRRPLEVATANGAELTSNYLSATYSHWLTGDTALHPADYWRQVLKKCPPSTVFVARRKDREVQEVLFARLPLLAQNSFYVVYGPCQPPDPEGGSRDMTPNEMPTGGESDGILLARNRPDRAGPLLCTHAGAVDRERARPTQRGAALLLVSEPHGGSGPPGLCNLPE